MSTNTQTGDNVLWSIVGANPRTVFSRLTLSPPPLAEYHVEFRGDFNGDHHADLLWRNYETGENIIGLMNGNLVVGAAILPPIDSPAWQPRIVADFTGDDQLDIVWRHAESGDTYIWALDRSRWIESIFLNKKLPEWKLFPAGDVDGNGTEDFHWCNPQTGENLLWRMEGATVLEEVVLPMVSHGQFPPEGLKPFDFNRLANQFDRHCPPEDNPVWRIDRANLIGSSVLPLITPDSDWESPTGSFDNFVRQIHHREVPSTESGSNWTNGSPENDLIYGNSGNDTLAGHDGDDLIFGDSANDFLDGGLGNDVLSGDAESDTLLGGLYSGLYIGSFDLEDYYRDWIFQDTLTGGSRSDTFVLRTLDHRSTLPSIENYYTTPPLPTPDNADRITDFEDGIDRLLLPDRIGFAQLSFDPIGDRGESTFIYAPYLIFSAGIPGYSATSAILENVAVSQISSDDFVTDSQDFLRGL